ncbi:hypothetical protein L226DRAFT_574418 [Lentinus tigrinus ALCF2SS1-7]|uniref:Uncharacterized protein n=1 Tax=Lentinus tigrinus ALCF2SS1-6 TaxID=1328759 RepID=A0A5C2S9C7_9APHY|nr:hypothetical protein L227DRAFT_611383 [Lentinus tigrinus ALCF2SS1-6]RPD70981.1 hypothetical protein L226DRAFT_574418 [Lentinus tigrinus ALCF2SS1-7]
MEDVAYSTRRPGASETGARDAVVSAPQKAVETDGTQVGSWRKSIVSLRQQIIDAQEAEVNHRLAEKAGLREEQERLEAGAEALRAREAAAAAEVGRLEALQRARVERETVKGEERARRLVSRTKEIQTFVDADLLTSLSNSIGDLVLLNC